MCEYSTPYRQDLLAAGGRSVGADLNVPRLAEAAVGRVWPAGWDGVGGRRRVRGRDHGHDEVTDRDRPGNETFILN